MQSTNQLLQKAIPLIEQIALLEKNAVSFKKVNIKDKVSSDRMGPNPSVSCVAVCVPCGGGSMHNIFSVQTEDKKNKA